MFVGRGCRVRGWFSALIALGAAGCATVSLDPSVKEISLTSGQSALHEASRTFRREALEQDWASGETGLARLPQALSGVDSSKTTAGAYMDRLRAVQGAEARLRRVRADVRRAAAGLETLTVIAGDLAASGASRRSDVVEFELALIQAGQARDTFSKAIAGTPGLAALGLDAASELAVLDRAMAGARSAADVLAQAAAPAGLS